MLVLSRKATQQIQIGENIVVTIVQVKGQGVRIGIEAPGEVRIVRAEIAGKPTKPVAGEASPARPVSDDQRPPRKPKAISPVGRLRGAATDECFSPPVYSADEPDTVPPIGESSGLFPRLRERVACPDRMPRHVEPSCGWTAAARTPASDRF
ncbi:MAG TPA: carbon storage regulator [Pirellulales bacterium]|nr:carbon storage regulator [Pirellulales bacterium]